MNNISLDDMLLHSRTRQQLERLSSSPAHAIIMTAPMGSGKRTIAFSLAARLLELPDAAAVEDYVYFKTILPEKGKTSIGIEAVRDLQQFTKLKLPSAKVTGRIIYIPEAQQLSGEAQNALLKLLEEPPAGTIFILTVNHERQLLVTIRSRSQLLTVSRPERSAVEAYFANKGFDEKQIASAYFLSGGLPGLMTALLDDEAHPLKATVQQARYLLQASRFERLCQVDGLSKDKSASLQLLFVMRQMAQTALETSAGKITAANSGDNRPIRQWHKVVQACYEAEEAYAVSAQAKLTLTNLMLSI